MIQQAVSQSHNQKVDRYVLIVERKASITEARAMGVLLKLVVSVTVTPLIGGIIPLRPGAKK